jgi:hypothetical protein
MKLIKKIKIWYWKNLKNYSLSHRLKRKSMKKFNKLYGKFIVEKRRHPNRTELGRIIINASHHTCPVKGKNSKKWMRGEKGHQIRQKIREYLFNRKGLDFKKR